MSSNNKKPDKGNEELARGLKSRHVTMIALGGAIGAGIFQGSSSSIELAGPGVILSYLLAGIILYFVMQAMAEMAVQQPKAKTLRDLIQTILGPFAGFFAGWIYFISWMLVMAAEMAAAAGFLQYWFPDTPLWMLSLIVSVLITVINLFAVNIFGETEYWLSALKVSVLTLFILLGGVLIFAGFNGESAAGFANLTEHGGFLPFGISGIAASMLVVMFSFGGTEMIGMTLGETQNPEKVIPKAARSVIIRILVFYVLPILVIVSLMPWNEVGKQSPFVTVFDTVGIPYIGGFMNFVLLTAVISAANTGMYAASRLLYTQALDGNAPQFFSKLSSKKVPVRALLASTSFLYIGVIIAVFAEGETFGYLMVVPGYAILFIWIMLTFAHLRSRKHGIPLKGFYVKSFPYTSWFSLLALLAILAGILITSPPVGTFIALAICIILTLIYLIGAKK